MPTLYILAGPNGAGKTTYYYTALEKKFIEQHLPFINVDVFTKELGDYTAENFAKAEMIYREKVAELLKDKTDFMIESNLARDSDYEWIEKVQKYGYDIVLYFLCTDDINVNINRIHRRVKEGGHDVPVGIIMHRYKAALSYLKTKLHLFKEIYFIDNSSDEAMEVGYKKNNNIIELLPAPPKWLDDVLSIERRLQRKKNN
ncbi:MAG: zeta toxin family protein [Parafilimonas sp.]|nr:zeta toxin family protein [Parafilimonas sp.]